MWQHIVVERNLLLPCLAAREHDRRGFDPVPRQTGAQHFRHRSIRGKSTGGADHLPAPRDDRDVRRSEIFLRAIETAAPSFAVKPIATPVHEAADIERAISAFAHGSNGGLIVLPSAFVAVHRKLIFEQAAQHRLPTVYGFRYFAADGGLMSYGVDVQDLFRRSAAYVDGILKGVKPGELPVQTPTKYQLLINLKAAKALSLTLPPTTLAIADEFIE